MVKIEPNLSPQTIITSDHKLTYDTKNKILLGEYGIQNVNSLSGFGTFPEKLNEFSLKNFSNNFNIKIINVSKANKKSENEIRVGDKDILTLESRANLDIEFDIIGAEAALVNAFRRILLADVPSMALEKCYLYQNTSIVQDEILCHRLGLVPLKIDPRKCDYRPHIQNLQESPNLGEPNSKQVNERIYDTIRFKLHVKSSWKEGKKPESLTKSGARSNRAPTGGSKLLKEVQEFNDKDLFENSHVYSRDLIWVPLNDAQKEYFKDDPPRPVHDDILLARLRPNQEIKLVIDAVKGVGSDHAKFSPVATASYRLHPTIDFKEHVYGKQAKKLQACFPPGVIEIDEDTRAFVGENLRNDVISREVYRHEDLKNKVQLGRLKNHFIFNIESTGAVPAKDLFIMATEILQEKCQLISNELSDVSSSSVVTSFEERLKNEFAGQGDVKKEYKEGEGFEMLD